MEIFLVMAVLSLFIYLFNYSDNCEQKYQNEAWQRLANEFGLKFIEEYIRGVNHTLVSGLYRSRAVTLHGQNYIKWGRSMRRVTEIQIIVALKIPPNQQGFLTPQKLDLLADPLQKRQVDAIFLAASQAALGIGGQLILSGNSQDRGLQSRSDWKFLVDHLCDLAEAIEQQGGIKINETEAQGSRRARGSPFR